MADGVKVGEAFVEVHPDTKAFATELDTQVEGIGKKASAKLGSIVAAGAFAAGTKSAIDSAKKLEEAVGGTTAVFKENSVQIDAFAKSAAKNLGLSESAARELTTQIGSALKGYGFTLDEATEKSQELTTLGGDLAATFAGDTREAVEALSAALRGEFDPLERYGVAINQTLIDQKAVALGLAASTSNVDQHARAQAALALITERSADAQGQFGREAGTASGAAKIAAAEAENSAAKLGTNLLPVYQKAVELAGTAAKSFGALPGPLQTVTLALVGMAALAGPLGSVKDRLTDLHSGDLGQSKLAATGAVVAGLAVSYGIWADAMDRAAQSAKGAIESGRDIKSLEGLEGRQRDIAEQGAKLRDEINRVQEDLLHGSGDPRLARYINELGKLGDALAQEQLQMGKVHDQAVFLAEQTGVNADETTKWLGEQLALGKTFASNEEALKAYTETEQKETTSAEKAKDAAKLNAEAHKDLADRVNDAYDAYQSIIGTSLSYTEAQRDVQVKIGELNDLYKSGTANANDYAAKQEELLKASDAQAKAAVDEAEAQATLEGRHITAAEKARIYKEELDKLAEKYPAIAGQLQQFKDQLDKIPNTKEVNIELKVKDLTAGLLEGLKGPNPLANVPLLGGLAGRASGGPVSAGKPYIVGEEGPELMVPGSSGTVVPNVGAGITMNVYGMGLSNAEAAEMLAQRLAITLVGAA